MARKRASLKDKGEEILGLKRGGQGADILFGLDAESSDTPETEESPDAGTPETGDLPQGEADLDETASGEEKPAKGGKTPSAGTQPATATEGLPQGEADLNEQDLEKLLGAEAAAGEADTSLPQLATTPAASGPPALEPTTRPPALERPAPAPPPVPPASRTTSPPALERPAPAPPPAPPTSRTPPKPAERPASTPPPARPAPKPVEPPVSASPPAPVSPPKPVEPPVSASAPAPPPANGPVVLPGSPPTDVHPPAGVPPPSTATGAPDLSMPRPGRHLQLIGDDFDLLAEEPSDDTKAAEKVSAPETMPLTDEQKAELLQRPSVQKELDELNQEIDAQYDRILRENVSVSKPITDWAQSLLAEARVIVLAREVDKLPIAEWNVEQVRARLDRAYESQEQARRYSVPILIWGFAWFLLFVYLIFDPTLVLQLLTVNTLPDALLDPQIFLQALFFGGIGGVAAVFYHLFKYMRARSFDSQYVLSYFGKPINGMIVGSIVYLSVFGARFVGLAVFQGQQPTTDIAGLRLILYVLAISAGFKENLAFDLLNRTVKAVLGGDSQTEDQETSIQPPATQPTTES
jgi:hypothetical protein